ncbi:MAG: lipase maturation factor family protein [Deltaproteobacteria bacterium]|nr:lipase maturation factor family protein [Deltaproteobacteria bacterium]
MKGAKHSQYWFTRFVFQRALGIIYFIGFLIILTQYRALLGVNGVLPVRFFLSQVRIWDVPSLLWISSSDGFALTLAVLGAVGALGAAVGASELFGIWVSSVVWGLLWLLYLSFVNVGQVFYGYGWESLLLETGFLAIFLGSARTEPPRLIIWLYRWVLFRVMFGAGLIKLRGDSCWWDLSCMQYHYETQPLPNPMSWYFHQLPPLVHKASVVFTHFVEVVVPFAFFGPRLARHIAGCVTIVFQLVLIVSGNLSWLNYLTLVLCVACFDDSFFALVIKMPRHAARAIEGRRRAMLSVLGLFIVVLSVRPALNLLSSGQLMNSTFDALHLVNTYGAFGNISRRRLEIIFEGTSDDVPDKNTRWQVYEFECKPGDPRRRPCIISPFHLRLDWQLWFAAMSPPQLHPWIFSFVAKLLQGDRAVLDLLSFNPFPGAPPAFVRASLYEYHFTKRGSDGGAWWTRQLVREYFRPLQLRDLAAGG